MAMRERSSSCEAQIDHSSDLFVHRVERMVTALSRYAHAIVESGPDHPCTEEHVHDVPLSEWRRAVTEWCHAEVVQEEHGQEVVTGLRLALNQFDDDELVDFLLRIV